MPKKIIILLSTTGILAVAAYIAWQNNVAVAQQASDDQGHPALREGGRGQGRPFRRPEGGRVFSRMFALRSMASSAAICATDKFVYVVKGNTLYQFEADGLKLVTKVTLEKEAHQPPPFGPPRGRRRGPPQQHQEQE